MLRNKLSRRRVVAGAGGISAAAILHWPANAAKLKVAWVFRTRDVIGSNDPQSPSSRNK